VKRVRPSIIGDLKLSTTPEHEPSVAAPPEPPANPAPAGRKPRPDIVHTSVYLPKAVHRQLREIAFTTDQKIHDLIIEGIDATLRKYGHSGVER
jgi:hypothetical protein